MEVSPSEPADDQPKVVFRGKKRKAYRQRAEKDDTEIAAAGQEETLSTDSKAAASDNNNDNTAIATTPDDKAATGRNEDRERGNADESAEEGLSVAEVLRRRNARKSKLRGVRFGAPGDGTTANAAGEADEDELSLMIREEEKRVQEAPAAASAGGSKGRFAPQTGMVGELVNKHMEEYIEAELARKRSSAPGGQGPADGSSLLSPERASTGMSASTLQQRSSRPVPERHIAVQGKLVEVDLGEEMRNRNAAMTDRAARKLRGEEVEDDEDSSAPPSKVRLGKDGKPWRPRNRRGSDDVKRDQLVEEFLAENRFTDVYEAPRGQDGGSAAEDDEFEGSADARIAEEFRREFMDAMAMRRQRRRNMADSARQRPKVRRDDEILRGPKLGGSRNERAAMRDILLKQQADRKRAG